MFMSPGFQLVFIIEFSHIASNVVRAAELPLMINVLVSAIEDLFPVYIASSYLAGDWEKF